MANLQNDDYFEEDDTIVYKKKVMEEMVENNEIYSADRNYNTSSGFNRIK